MAVACCTVGGTENSTVCVGPFEGGRHYLHYLHHSFSSVSSVQSLSHIRLFDRPQGSPYLRPWGGPHRRPRGGPHRRPWGGVHPQTPGRPPLQTPGQPPLQTPGRLHPQTLGRPPPQTLGRPPPQTPGWTPTADPRVGSIHRPQGGPHPGRTATSRSFQASFRTVQMACTNSSSGQRSAFSWLCCFCSHLVGWLWTLTAEGRHIRRPRGSCSVTGCDAGVTGCDRV